ncbi:MAG: xylulokinase [Clostridia bacterium]|nr:xylulokinase [Clostridia bacterium]
MSSYIGIDLGTSSVKLLLLSAEEGIIKTVTKEYPVSYPRSGWSEQNPEDWFQAVKTGVKELLSGQDKTKIRGIGFGGQMHGLVALDENDNVIRPCILWNDGRTEKQTAYLNQTIGKKRLSELTANVAFAGFTAPKSLWLKENEPENFSKIAKIMLPKDYLVYRLTGAHVSDYSDAAGTLLLDVKNKRWSKEMCDICSVKEAWLPRLCESYESVGCLSKNIAEEWGMPKTTVVAAGAGDNAAAAIGTGTIYNGSCNISLGTSGTVFISQDNFGVDDQNALHSYCHANGKFHLMGCILSAASCNVWWMNVLQSKDFAAEQAGAEEYLGKNEVYFLPYLMGERSPHNDVNAKGAFIGLRPNTTRTQMTLAVMEGVAFALRDCLEVARENGLKITATGICGGGAKSKLWRKIIANVLGVTVEVPKIEEGPSYGAAILAMVASGKYATLEEAVKANAGVTERIYPDQTIAKNYDERYNSFRKLYPALKETFKEI